MIIIRLYFWTYFFITVGVIILFLIGATLGCWFNSEERKVYKSNKMIKKYKDIDINKIFFLIEYEIRRYQEITNENPSKIYISYDLSQLLFSYSINKYIFGKDDIKIFGLPVSIDTEHKGFYYCIGGHDGEIEIEEENDR